MTGHPGASDREVPLLRHGHDVNAPVLLPAIFVMFLASWLLFSVAEHAELFAGDAHLSQVVLGRLRALVTGPTVEAVTLSRNASRYSPVVQP